MIGSLA